MSFKEFLMILGVAIIATVITFGIVILLAM